MEQILQKVAGAEIFSLLESFSRHNQVLVTPSDQLKISFRTPLGTFAYRKMPYGLINAGSTFTLEMDIAFIGLMHNCVVVYLDYVTIFSKRRHDHIFHL